jgi:protein SCO1/2
MLKIIFLIFISAFCFGADQHILETPSGGNFSIETTINRSFKLLDLKGNTVFLFFGYTHCPNVCPLTLSRLKRLSKELEAKKIRDYKVLFISVDNYRDSLDSLKKYIAPFGPHFIAGVANDQSLRKILQLYGARFSKIVTEAGEVIFDHTDSVFIVSPDGKWRNTIHFNAPYSEYYQSYLKSKIFDIEREKRISELRAKRELILIDKMKSCDLGNSSCRYNFSDKTFLTISLSPLPVKTEKEFNILIETNSSKLIPLEADFEGIQQNMGFIRPQLLLDMNKKYRASIELPICEQKKMDWKLRLILKDSESKRHFLEFYFSTK